MSIEEQDLLYCDRKRKLTELRRTVLGLKIGIADGGRALQAAGERACAVGRKEAAEPLSSAQAMAALGDTVSPQSLLELLREYSRSRAALSDLEEQVDGLEP